jgi:hypothetical protein
VFLSTWQAQVFTNQALPVLYEQAKTMKTGKNKNKLIMKVYLKSWKDRHDIFLFTYNSYSNEPECHEQVTRSMDNSSVNWNPSIALVFIMKFWNIQILIPKKVIETSIVDLLKKICSACQTHLVLSLFHFSSGMMMSQFTIKLKFVAQKNHN